jgi:homoserine dehydrogenase
VAIADSKGAVIGSALDLERRRDCSTLEAIEEVDADVVIEAAPTSLLDPNSAIDRIRTAFRTGKHVVCVNKAPLALAMPALQELAEFNRVQFRFSGTVGGGTPILDWAKRCAEGDEILGVKAILNGTTNYILTRMAEGSDFSKALAEAQEKGYAEKDPSMDLDGIDTAIKLVILANSVMRRRVVLSDVSIQGIRNVPGGGSWKLIGEIGERLIVAPREVDPRSSLAVQGTLNAVTLTMKNTGEVTLIGRGAGGRETATSIVRDLLTIWHRLWE